MRLISAQDMTATTASSQSNPIRTSRSHRQIPERMSQTAAGMTSRLQGSASTINRGP